MTVSEAPDSPDPLAVFVEIRPRVAGVESGRLHNAWLDCPFSIAPAARTRGASEPRRGYQRGFQWRAEFAALDGQRERKTLTGISDTRALAHIAVLNALTAHVSLVVRDRAKWVERNRVAQMLSVKAGVPLAKSE